MRASRLHLWCGRPARTCGVGVPPALVVWASRLHELVRRRCDEGSRRLDARTTNWGLFPAYFQRHAPPPSVLLIFVAGVVYFREGRCFR
ncbi:MAG: hypothetical protein ACRDD1_17565 [Planctomycetia bacterium]